MNTIGRGRRVTVSMVPAVSGARGTISDAVAQRSGQFDALIETLKPRMAVQVAVLPLHSGIKALLERVESLAGSITYDGAGEVKAEFSRIVGNILEDQRMTNLLALQAKGGNQDTHIEDAVRTSIREAMANYWRQCLRDNYVGALRSTYAPEIAAGDLQVVAGVPEDSSARLIQAAWMDLSRIADRSFCFVTSSRTIFVTIGRKDFEILAGRASESVIADHEFEGGSLVKKDANLLTDAILHLPELRYWTRQTVGGHADMPDIVRTYDAYTLERSHDIEDNMVTTVAQVFPLYSKWKTSNKSRQRHRQASIEWHEATMSATDDVLKLFSEKSVASPSWAVGRGDIKEQMSVVAKSYLSWHALRAIGEVNAALENLRNEIAKLSKLKVSSLFYDNTETVKATKSKIIRLEEVLEELSVARSRDDRSAATSGSGQSDHSSKKAPNFVQALCGDFIREKLRKTRMKPFFDKLQATYDADPQTGRVQDGIVTIPSATYVKIALGKQDGTPLYTGYASVGPSPRGRHFAQARRDAERLAPGEFARLIAMSMPHLTDPAKDGAQRVEIDPEYSAYMEREIPLHFGAIPEDRRILLPQLSGQYRLLGYHAINDPHA